MPKNIAHAVDLYDYRLNNMIYVIYEYKKKK